MILLSFIEIALFSIFLVASTKIFQLNVQRLCKKEKYKGLLCGHTHLPQIKQNSDYIYFNTGDWIEACTAITEDREGSFELKSFSKTKSVLINKL